MVINGNKKQRMFSIIFEALDTTVVTHFYTNSFLFLIDSDLVIYLGYNDGGCHNI